MLLLFTLLPNLEFNPCPAALNKSQHRGGGVQQAGLSGRNRSDYPGHHVHFASFAVRLWLSKDRAAQSACPCGSQGSRNPRVIPSKLCLPPRLSLVLPLQRIPTRTQLPFFFMSFFLSLPLFCSHSFPPSSPNPFLIPLILLLPSPPLSNPLFQDNRADGRLFVLCVPLENQLSC